MRIFCKCRHSKTRHRAQFGESGTGACIDCGCSEMTTERYELFAGERRFLAKIDETGKIGVGELRKQIYDADDPASGAFDTILGNLRAAHFARESIETGTVTVSTTSAGRDYLKETARA